MERSGLTLDKRIGWSAFDWGNQWNGFFLLGDDEKMRTIIGRNNQLKGIVIVITTKNHVDRGSTSTTRWEWIFMDILRIWWVDMNQPDIDEILDLVL